MTLMALVVAVTAGAQVMDTILTGNTVNMNLNYAKLDSIIADLQAKVATLEAAQNSTFDGDYSSLTNKPTIPSNVSDLTNDAGYTTFDGDYSSLSNQPTIPSNVSDLTNDAGYTTFDGDYSSLTNKPTIPSNVSDLEFVCGSSYTYEGHDYATVLIGGQCWFAENLRSENYTDGSVIPADLDDAAWSTTTAGAVTVYNEGNSSEGTHLATYGRLYNWYAVDDARGLCPSGWHVPTDSEYMTLEMELGMSYTDANNTLFRDTDQGAQMKSSASDSPAFDGTNTSGFSGLAGGFRGSNGVFYSAGSNGFFWSASSASAYGTFAWERSLVGGYNEVGRDISNLTGGFSVRCVRD